jgi:hypothetical protein
MNPTVTFDRSICPTPRDSKKKDAPIGRVNATVWDVIVREGRPPLACRVVQEQPIIGRPVDKTAESMPSGGTAATIRQVADSSMKVTAGFENHSVTAVLLPARLRASAAKEAGFFVITGREGKGPSLRSG